MTRCDAQEGSSVGVQRFCESLSDEVCQQLEAAGGHCVFATKAWAMSGVTSFYAHEGCAWEVSAWSVCSATCGQGTQTRQIWCSSGDGADCAELDAPATEQECERHSGCEVVLSEWSTCHAPATETLSENCGVGTRSRTIKCLDEDNNEIGSELCRLVGSRNAHSLTAFATHLRGLSFK